MLLSLGLTSALLLALAPAPLTPDAVRSLYSIEQQISMDPIFETDVAIQPGRWQCIYIHHSKSSQGNVLLLGQRPGGLRDHFVIGNGQGCGDGELQVAGRWHAQQPATEPEHPPPLRQLEPVADRYISICLVGDFDRQPPTPTQIQRVGELVQALQRRLGIRGQFVLVFDRPGSSAGIGRYFPVADLGRQILP